MELPTDEPEFRAARDALDATLREHQRALGPWETDSDDDPVAPVQGALLSHWVLVAAWLAPEGSDTYITRATSHNTPSYIVRGLLGEASDA